MNLKRTAPAVALAATVMLGLPAVTDSPVVGVSVAQAATVDWNVRVVGGFGHYQALGTRNGNPCWSGPIRTLKYRAVNDGGRWLNNPYCP